MLRLLCLCLWQAIIIGVLWSTTPSVLAQEAGIQIRGPKSTDVFPHHQYGPITSSDTLWKIAAAVRPDPSVSIYQVMQALFELNPNAFANNNRNHLVNGQYLQIPSIEKIRLIDPYAAKNRSENDDRKWQKKTTSVKVAKKKEIKPEEQSVKKKDLDAAKVEINEQLKTFDGEQKEKLENIQRDVLDSIDGLQAILQENESLKNRLTNFNDQLGSMQQEVAKGKEVKQQMDSMLELQRELLAKAEERERQLLLEQQQAELERQNNQIPMWVKVLLGTLPVFIIGGIVAFFIARKKKKQEPQETIAKEVTPETVAEQPAKEEAIDEDLSLDGELSLDDELSIDLTESDDDSDDLFSDDISSLDDELLDDELTDDVIHLDDDLDELDDLEDISLDDDTEIDEPLDGGELDQSDLDDLLSSDDDSEPLEGGELDQGDLDDLLSGLDGDLDEELEEESEPLEGGELGQGDLDALLTEDNDEPEEKVDIDSAIEDGADVTDPDDIDALLDSVGAEPEPEPEPSAADAIEDGADVTDPDDIDALLASVGAEPESERA